MNQIQQTQLTSPAPDPEREPLLQLNNLQTYFFTGEGVVHAVDGATLDVLPGQTLGIVGESGCGKSVAAKSILQIVDRPGRIVGGEILYRYRDAAGHYRQVDLLKLPPYSAEMKAMRGGQISMIFQEPMTSLARCIPWAIRSSRQFVCTATSTRRRRAARPSNGCAMSASPTQNSAWANTPTG